MSLTKEGVPKEELLWIEELREIASSSVNEFHLERCIAIIDRLVAENEELRTEVSKELTPCPCCDEVVIGYHQCRKEAYERLQSQISLSATEVTREELAQIIQDGRGRISSNQIADRILSLYEIRRK